MVWEPSNWFGTRTFFVAASAGRNAPAVRQAARNRVADTGLVITRYEDLRSDMSLFLHLRDGTVFVQVAPICVPFHGTSTRRHTVTTKHSTGASSFLTAVNRIETRS